MSEEELRKVIIQLEKQKEYKNFKELCNSLKWSTMGGSTRKKYYKILEGICRYRKEGQRIIIEEIYSETKLTINEKGLYTSDKKLKEYKKYNYNINYKDGKSIGIYKITLGNEIYIGSTIQNFRQRFLHHINKDNPLYTKEMLDSGATFEIVQICDEMSENEIRHIENDYIQEYRNNPEWVVVNSLSNVQIKGESPQKYKKIKVREEDYEISIQILQSFGIKIVDGLLKEYTKEELKDKIDKK